MLVKIVESINVVTLAAAIISAVLLLPSLAVLDLCIGERRASKIAIFLEKSLFVNVIGFLVSGIIFNCMK